MKGVVFTEFMEMVESTFSADMVDKLIEGTDLASGGSYTSIGTYPHEELVAMVVELSKQTEVPVAALIQTFGQYLFKRFLAGHPQFFEGAAHPFDFLESVEHHIHVEVRKLYPDAELPRFVCTRNESGQFRMQYSSSRPFADLAQGLIEGTIEHFGKPLTLDREGDPDDATSATFVLGPADGPA